MDDLKLKLKKQQVVDEVRRAEMYSAIIKSQETPSILPTVTHIILDREQENTFAYPEFIPKLKNVNNRYANSQAADSLDVMLAAQANITNPHYKYTPTDQTVRIPSPETTPYQEGSGSGLKYLSYFNTPDEEQKGIRIPDQRLTYNIDLGRLTRSALDRSEGQGQETVTQILKKNKARLEILEDLEMQELVKYRDHGVSLIAKPDKKGLDDETYQMINSEMMPEHLIVKLNNPRKYVDDL